MAMSKTFKSPLPFIAKKKGKHHAIHIISEADFSDWIKEQKPALKAKCENLGFKGKNSQLIIERNDKGEVLQIFAGLENAQNIYNFAEI